VSARVVVRIRAGVVRSFPVGEKPAFIGRDKAAAVSLAVEGVSRHHARITWDGKHHWLEDVKSTNGTFLNGKPVSRERLQHLDVITLGRQLDLVFLVQSGSAAPAKVQGILKASLVRDPPDGTVHEIAPGEVTVGRALSCNLVAEAAAVSKVHARIERTRERLLLEDLGSANGTFVNDVRVVTAFLKDGDRVSLAGVETYLVSVELGEVTSASGKFTGVATVNTVNRPRFNADWKTRYDWSTSEQLEIAALRERLADELKAREEQRTRRNPVVRAGAGTTLMPSKGGAPAAKAAPLVPAGGRTAPPPSAPVKPVTKPAAAPATRPPAAPATPPATPSPKPSTPAAPPVPPAPPAAPAPSDAAPVPAPKPAARPVGGPILEIRLSAKDIELVVREPGAHDLGRAADVDLRVSQPTVSRRHARIILSEDRAMAYVQDGGGANGTRLNGKEVAKLASLAEGDTIGIGDVSLKVSLKRG
jgi:pSer/pThr/pTyr-binding forkhead associated (FHA) protein